VSSSSDVTSSALGRSSSSAPETVTQPSDGLRIPLWRVLVGGALVASFALSVVTTVRGGLLWDDLGNLRFVGETGLADYLLTPVFDHLAPGHRALTILQAAIGPTNTVAMHVVLAGILTLALAGFVASAHHLYGRRAWIPAVTVLLSASTATVATMLWFAAALHQIPALAATLWSLAFFLRYRERRDRRALTWSVVAFVLGLTFVSKALLAFAVILLVDQLLLRPGRLRDVPTRALDEWPLWTAYALPAGIYLAFAATLAGAGPPLSSVRSVALGIRDGWVDRLVPLMVGWDPGSSAAERETDRPAVLLLQLALLVLLALSVRRRRDSLRAIAIVAVLVLVNGLLTMAWRIDAWGPNIPLFHRYWLEPLVLAALLLPWGFARPPDVGAPRWLRHPRRWVVAPVGLVLLAAVAATSAWSATRLLEDHHAFRADAWLTDVRTAVASAGGEVALVDDLLPIEYFPAWTLRDLAFLLPDARFPDDPDGRLVRGDRLATPEWRPAFELRGADLPTNTLATVEGEVEVRGDELCTSSGASVAVLLNPSEPRRWGRVTLDGEGVVWFVPQDPDGGDAPARELLDGPMAGAELLFPIDRRPLAALELRLWPAPGEELCLDDLSVGTIANAPRLPGEPGR
jgi:hypothetical protein